MEPFLELKWWEEGWTDSQGHTDYTSCFTKQISFKLYRKQVIDITSTWLDTKHHKFWKQIPRPRFEFYVINGQLTNQALKKQVLQNKYLLISRDQECRVYIIATVMRQTCLLVLKISHFKLFPYYFHKLFQLKLPYVGSNKFYLGKNNAKASV